MKKEVKLVLSLVGLVIIGFAMAYGVYISNQVKNDAPVATNKLPDNLIRPDSQTKGVPDASTTLIEFLDPECESCAAFYPLVKDILKDYDGKIKFVVRYMPFHKSSVMAIEATEAAGLQGKYWEMQELLFKKAEQWGHRETPDAEIFKIYAEELGLDVARFASDMKNPAWAQKAQRDAADGSALGVKGTPSFFVNQTAIKELSVEAIRAAIDQSLSSADPK